ncbi:retinol dehydrogenase [Cadophora sp. DSE1049]|nr:retinol dehydrogenase [Cadophora sp. DSE1049]
MSSSNSTWDPPLLPDLTGRIVLITGGHSGLGLATTRRLVDKNAKVYIASRSLQKATEAVRNIKETYSGAQLEVLEMDLADLESVRRGAEDFRNLTPQGIETQLQTNYLSHRLLTSLLLPTLLSTANNPRTPANAVRIINVSSDGHAKLAPKHGINFEDMNMESASTWTRYGHSKLCQVLHAKALAERYGGKGVLAVSLHPGTVRTGLSKGPRGSTWWYRFIQPLVELGAPGPETGCWGIVWCAASSEIGEMRGEDVNGGYFEGVGKLSTASKAGEDGEMARKLWAWSEGNLSEMGLLGGTESEADAKLEE